MNSSLFSQERPALPPERVAGEWTELAELGFSQWPISSFLGWDSPFDGGSKVFFFEAGQERKFQVIVANQAYWTGEDKRLKQQVVYLQHDECFYLLQPKSAEEKALLEALKRAEKQLDGAGRRDPKLLLGLSEVIESRSPIFRD